MNKNIIIAVSVVLLAITVGVGIFSYQGQTTLKGKIKTLESEKLALQNKINKGLIYANSLDLLYEPIRKQMGMPTRLNLSDTEWLSKLTETTELTADSELQNDLATIKTGGSEASLATVLFIERAVSAIVDVLK